MMCYHVNMAEGGFCVLHRDVLERCSPRRASPVTRRAGSALVASAAILLTAAGCGSSASSHGSGATTAPTKATSPGAQDEAVARSVTKDLAAGQDNAVVTHFDAKVKAELSAKQLAGGWQSATASLGPYKGTGQLATKQVGTNLVVEVLANFQQGKLVVETTFDAKGEISGFYLHPGSSASTTTTAGST